MCGIAGIFNPKNQDVTKAVKILLTMNESRGNHATGIYSPDIGIIKEPIPAVDFIATQPIFKTKFNSELYLLHTRFATHGVNTTENAHPFQLNNTILTHNGVLSGYEWVKATYNYSHEVDSANLLPILQNRDFNKLKEITGPMNLAFTYNNENRLYLHRRTNPLHLVRIKNVLYYSSEAGPLDIIKILLNSRAQVYILQSNHIITIGENLKYNVLKYDTTPPPPKPYNTIIQQWDEMDSLSYNYNTGSYSKRFNKTRLIDHIARANDPETADEYISQQDKAAQALKEYNQRVTNRLLEIKKEALK